jgi:hypothetical protein
MRWYTGCLFLFTLCLGQRLVAQNRPVDSTAFFPLGLWGIWIDINHDDPRLGAEPEWDDEVENFTNIHGNYMVHHIPEHVEDALIDRVSPLGYRINISREPLITGRSDSSSLHRWCTLTDSIPTSLDTVTVTDGWDWQDWRAVADRRISSLLHLYGGNSNVLTFYIGHEEDIYTPPHVVLRAGISISSAGNGHVRDTTTGIGCIDRKPRLRSRDIQIQASGDVGVPSGASETVGSVFEPVSHTFRTQSGGVPESQPGSERPELVCVWFLGRRR